jgi:hypothetical protein
MTRVPPLPARTGTGSGLKPTGIRAPRGGGSDTLPGPPPSGCEVRPAAARPSSIPAASAMPRAKAAITPLEPLPPPPRRHAPPPLPSRAAAITLADDEFELDRAPQSAEVAPVTRTPAPPPPRFSAGSGKLMKISAAAAAGVALAYLSLRFMASDITSESRIATASSSFVSAGNGAGAVPAVASPHPTLGVALKGPRKATPGAKFKSATKAAQPRDRSRPPKMTKKKAPARANLKTQPHAR